MLGFIPANCSAETLVQLALASSGFAPGLIRWEAKPWYQRATGAALAHEVHVLPLAPAAHLSEPIHLQARTGPLPPNSVHRERECGPSLGEQLQMADGCCRWSLGTATQWRKNLFYVVDQWGLWSGLSQKTPFRAVEKVNLYGFDISMETARTLNRTLEM